ncbi:hypothetical protein AAIR98_001767 [Elusimicrobium simillimum]|uniref:hypothetical protein n=1 Tax=Elusimicrobium simillimum TaxID=3143438 RepID=UPI003C6EF8BB
MEKEFYQMDFVDESCAGEDGGILILWCRFMGRLTPLSVKCCVNIKDEIRLYNEAQPMRQSANNKIIFSCIKTAVSRQDKEVFLKAIHRHLHYNITRYEALYHKISTSPSVGLKG